MSDIFLHNPNNKLSQELVDSFDDTITVLDFTDNTNVKKYTNISKLPCFVLTYPEHTITQTVLDSNDNEVEETVTIPSGYLEFFMLDEVETTDDDGTRLHTYSKKSLSDYTTWKLSQESKWS